MEGKILYEFTDKKFEKGKLVGSGRKISYVLEENNGEKKIVCYINDKDKKYSNVLKLPNGITAEMIADLNEENKEDFFRGGIFPLKGKKMDFIFNLESIFEKLRDSGSIEIDPKKATKIFRGDISTKKDDEELKDIIHRLNSLEFNSNHLDYNAIEKEIESKEEGAFIGELENALSRYNPNSEQDIDSIQAQGNRIREFISNIFANLLGGYHPVMKDCGEYRINEKNEVLHKFEVDSNILVQENKDGNIDTVICSNYLLYLDPTTNMIAGNDDDKNFNIQKNVFHNQIIEYEQIWRKYPKIEIFAPFSKDGSHYQLAKLRKVNNQIYMDIVDPFHKEEVRRHKINRNKDGFYSVELDKFKEFKFEEFGNPNFKSYCMNINQHNESFTCGYHTVALLLDEIIAKNCEKIKDPKVDLSDKKKLKRDNKILKKILGKVKNIFESFYERININNESKNVSEKKRKIQKKQQKKKRVRFSNEFVKESLINLKDPAVKNIKNDKSGLLASKNKLDENKEKLKDIIQNKKNRGIFTNKKIGKNILSNPVKKKEIQIVPYTIESDNNSLLIPKNKLLKNEKKNKKRRFNSANRAKTNIEETQIMPYTKNNIVAEFNELVGNNKKVKDNKKYNSKYSNPKKVKEFLNDNNNLRKYLKFENIIGLSGSTKEKKEDGISKAIDDILKEATKNKGKKCEDRLYLTEFLNFLLDLNSNYRQNKKDISIDK